MVLAPGEQACSAGSRISRSLCRCRGRRWGESWRHSFELDDPDPGVGIGFIATGYRLEQVLEASCGQTKAGPPSSEGSQGRQS